MNERGDRHPEAEELAIDYRNLLVSCHPRRERPAANPARDNPLVPGVPVWSVFELRRRTDGDALAHALKGASGWKFASAADRERAVGRIDAVSDRYLATHSRDVTLIDTGNSPIFRAVPDLFDPVAYPWSKFLAEVFAAKVPGIKTIEGGAYGLGTDDVRAIAMEDLDSPFRQVHAGRGAFERAYERLQVFLRDMEKRRDGKYDRRLVRDAGMRKAIDATLKASRDGAAEDANKINGSDVLILDARDLAGEQVETIRASYAPKSLSVLACAPGQPPPERE